MRQLSMTLHNGSPALVDQTGRPVFTGIRAGIFFDGGKSNRQTRWCTGSWRLLGDEAQGEVCCDDVRIEYRREGEGMVLRTCYTHLGSPMTATERLVGLDGLWCCGFDTCLYNGCMPANGVIVNEMGGLVNTLRMVEGQHITGTENAALIDREGRHLLVGYVTFERMFPCMDIGSEGRLNCWQQTERHPLATGGTIEGDWLYIGECTDVRQGLMEYARLTARYMGSRAGIFDSPDGYCTWYYYGNGLRPETVYENLKTLQENKHRLPAKYFNLDNGWLKEWGDWTENEKFACGMKKIADDIYAAGYLPGIWLAPFGAKMGGRLHREHPDWFVRRWDNQGPVEIPYGSEIKLALDMSHPEVKEYIRDTFRRMTAEWGYRHVKIDMMAMSLAPGRHHDPNYTSLMNYREGLRLMRESMTGDAFLLACSSPMAPSLGYADGIRTGSDIFHDWDCLRKRFNQNLKRYYYHNIWFSTDPDCLLTRTAANEDAECIRPCIRTEDEIRTFATAIMATGGAMIMSDKMPLLGEEQLQLLSWMYPINMQAAIPLDLMESFVPGVLDLGRREKSHLFALINWTDAPKQMAVDVGAGHVFEFWSQQYLGVRQGVTAFDIEPHGARILVVTDDAPLAAVGVNDCLCPAIKQHYEDGVLTARFLKKGETLYVHARKPVEAIEGCILRTADAARGLYAAEQTGDSLTARIRLA